MSVLDLARKRRSIRRFLRRRIPYYILEDCVDAARLAPSSMNLQPLEYIVVDDELLLPRIFSTLKWAGYIAPKGDPPPGEEPAAYIIILINRRKSPIGGELDVGIVAAYISLVALEKGVGSCILASVDRDRLREILAIPDHCEISIVLALGYPNENPIIEEFQDSIKYWKDDCGVLHVPKRKLEQVLHHNCYKNWPETN